MVLIRNRLPLWGAVLVAPLACNLVAVAGAALLYAIFGTRWAPVAMLPVWFRFAGRLLALVDSYETTESRRALAVLGGVVWLVVSLVLIVVAVAGLEQLAS